MCSKRLFTAVEPMQTVGRKLFRNKEGWELLWARAHDDEKKCYGGLKEDG